MQSHENKLEYWFIFQGDRLVLIDNHLPTNHNLVDIQPLLIRQHKIGQLNNNECFCAEINSQSLLPATLSLSPLRHAFESFTEWYGAIAKAYSIITWDKNNQFCGRCSNPTIHKPDTFERVCESCGLVIYPRISPSIIVRIRKNDHILMARSPHFRPGAFGLIAGFVEVGESLEDAVHREVKEEVNIQIKNLRFYGSQSWPFPDSLMIGFTADYDSGEIIIDENEIETADWYRFDNLPGVPSSNVSISRKLIQDFVNEQSKNNK